MSRTTVSVASSIVEGSSRIFELDLVELAHASSFEVASESMIDEDCDFATIYSLAEELARC